jgi:hypothetical protein
VAEYIETRLLRVQLTEQEVSERGRESAKLVGEIVDLHEQKKASASHFKSEIDARDARVKRVSRSISDGHEEREVSCIVLLDRPLIGQKTVIRRDTGEEVAVDVMNDSERQQPLPLMEVPKPAPEPEPEPETAPEKEPLLDLGPEPKPREPLLFIDDSTCELCQGVRTVAGGGLTCPECQGDGRQRVK